MTAAQAAPNPRVAHHARYCKGISGGGVPGAVRRRGAGGGRGGAGHDHRRRAGRRRRLLRRRGHGAEGRRARLHDAAADARQEIFLHGAGPLEGRRQAGRADAAGRVRRRRRGPGRFLGAGDGCRDRQAGRRRGRQVGRRRGPAGQPRGRAAEPVAARRRQGAGLRRRPAHRHPRQRGREQGQRRASQPDAILQLAVADAGAGRDDPRGRRLRPGFHAGARRRGVLEQQAARERPRAAGGPRRDVGGGAGGAGLAAPRRAVQRLAEGRPLHEEPGTEGRAAGRA